MCIFVPSFNEVLEAYRDKIEHYGGTIDKMGLSPVAARVYVYLLFSDERGATFEEITLYFDVSKSAVSNALKMLTSVGMVDAKTYGGKRKRFFYINFESTFNEESMSGKFRLMSEMFTDVRSARGVDDAFGKQLTNIALLYKMLLVEIPIILERWKRTISQEEEV